MSSGEFPGSEGILAVYCLEAQSSLAAELSASNYSASTKLATIPCAVSDDGRSASDVGVVKIPMCGLRGGL